MLNFLTMAGAPGGMSSSIIMIVAMLAIFYFMLIRPENKRKKEAEQMRSSVKTGDKITTIGGIIGTVVNVKDDKIVIETSADQVRIEFAKWAISTNETAAEAQKAEAQKAQEEDQRFHGHPSEGGVTPAVKKGRPKPPVVLIRRLRQ